MNQPRRFGPDRGWDPFTELQALRTELGRMVGSALVGAGGGVPDVELNENEQGWTVVARLPGVAPEEVALELDDRELCIRGRSEEEVNSDHGLPGGSRSRAFEYRVQLPSQADPERIDAMMDHGLLTVNVARSGRAEKRTITIGQLRSGQPDGRTRTGAGPVDPAADRELHQPDVSAGASSMD
ncbi:MAG TPA: Hsp20/alpha crystallin family protein [Micromonospora sp.]